MTTAKSKGTDFERTIVRTIRAFAAGALRPFRPHQEGWQDVGDVHGLSPFIGQCKNYKSWEDAIRLGLDGAEKQKVAAGEPYGVAFVKRARRSPGEAYAMMTTATFTRVLMRLRRAEELLRELSGPSDAFAEHMRLVDEEAARPFPSAAEGDRFAAAEEQS